MSAQADAGSNGPGGSALPDSDDSSEETSQEEPPVPSWNELSIIERVGLNSVEMSETDVETAFSQIAVAFRCDQYTLKQRLQAEEHARNLAEENIQLELSRGRETLETLKGLCLDSNRSKILQRLELSLDILGGTVERISNTAEVLGAVHQEARVSRAVELMVAHVENLKKRLDINEAELEEAKRMIQQQNPCRSTGDPRASPDPEESDIRRKYFQQGGSRRRVSISLIPFQTQEKGKLDAKRRSTPGTCPSPSRSSESICSAVTKEDGCSADDRPADPEETVSEAPAAPQPPPDPAPVPAVENIPPTQKTTSKMQVETSPLETLRQRHRGRSALSKKKADKDKRGSNIYWRISAGTCESQWGRRPLARWLHRCRWALLCLYLLVLLGAATLTYFLWKFHDDALEP